MHGPNYQKGMTFWSMLFVFGVIGIVALLAIKCTPIYLNHLKVDTAITDVSKDVSMSTASPFEIRRAIQRRFDVDDVKHLKTKDIKILRGDETRVISYDYEVRVSLFANISLVIQFDDKVQVKRE